MELINNYYELHYFLHPGAPVRELNKRKYIKRKGNVKFEQGMARRTINIVALLINCVNSSMAEYGTERCVAFAIPIETMLSTAVALYAKGNVVSLRSLRNLITNRNYINRKIYISDKVSKYNIIRLEYCILEMLREYRNGRPLLFPCTHIIPYTRMPGTLA